jgi:8-oxo-dGTP pyrophosphatase MutT (NUDIX family)
VSTALDEISEALRLALATARDVDRVRCVMRFRDEYLLLRHESWHRRNAKKWALPGGRVKHAESPIAAVRREILEELYLVLPDLVELGDFEQGGEIHRLYGCDILSRGRAFNTCEIAEVQWLDYAQIVRLALAGRLHRGFELAAINAYMRQSRSSRSIRGGSRNIGPTPSEL